MPAIEFFPYLGPNRRCDKTVVEITLKSAVDASLVTAARVAEIGQLLVEQGVLGTDERYPASPLPEDPMAAYASLLAQTALLFQCKAGHRPGYWSVQPLPERGMCIALVEHQHYDVGMTAVKLALELLTGHRKTLSEPFRMFSDFARQRQLPAQTEAIIAAAARRDIPAIRLEQPPHTREQFDAVTGGRCRCPNGLLMLGHGPHQRILDGTWSFDLNEDLRSGREHEQPDDIALHVLDRLFPDPAAARVPIIALTGTNGKTTTTRMVAHMVKHAGWRPGMVCTDGVFIDGRQVIDEDKSSRGGHLRVLSNKQVEMAVLETHHGGILGRGFAFRWCDIAVCLNVTEDHLGKANIETVDQMAIVKRALLERARHAAVLNADDPRCMAMVGAVTAETVCLVSMRERIGQLRQRVAGRKSCFCVLETIEGREWLVIYDEKRRLPVVATGDIPATFGGAARFNVSNAMHAALAVYQAGVGPGATGAALRRFNCSYELTPGRLNVFDQLPFRIVLDFAHNPDGMRSLCEFTDRLDVEGRRVVAFAGSSDRPDETIRKMGRSIAGHFDFYFCKEHMYKTGKTRRKVAHLLQQGLLEGGVAAGQTALVGNGEEVIFGIFDSCQPGDLLVMLMGHVEKHLVAGYVEAYARRVRPRLPA